MSIQLIGKDKIVGGAGEPLPLKGFPPGRARIHQRFGHFTMVYLRPPEGGIRKFYVVQKDGAWWPQAEVSANRVAKQLTEKIGST